MITGSQGRSQYSRRLILSGFPLADILPAELQGPSSLGSSPLVVATHHCTTLPILSKKTLARCRTSWERLVMAIIPREGKAAAPGGICGVQRWSQALSSPLPSGSWHCWDAHRGCRSRVKLQRGDLCQTLCREITASMGMCATGCLCKGRMGKSTSLSQGQRGCSGC